MESFIVEPERKTSMTASCYVLVACGGIAGIAAAVAAARGGKRVILLEREYALGGMATLGLVTIYLPLCDGMGNQLVYGIGEELLRLSIAHGAEANYPKAWLNGGSLEERIKNRYTTQFNPHLFALRVKRCCRSLALLYFSVRSPALLSRRTTSSMQSLSRTNQGGPPSPFSPLLIARATPISVTWQAQKLRFMLAATAWQAGIIISAAARYRSKCLVWQMWHRKRRLRILQIKKMIHLVKVESLDKRFVFPASTLHNSAARCWLLTVKCMRIS